MSNRIKGFTVILDDNYKDEDAEVIKTAIQMIKGVLTVESEISGMDDYITTIKTKTDIKNKLYNFINCL